MGIFGHALVWNMRSFLLLLFVMWSSRTECGWCYIVAPETSAMPDSLIRDNPRLHCNDMAMYCMRIVALRHVMCRDVYVFSYCFRCFYCLLNLVWSEKLLQKGHRSALWPDCSKAVDDLRAVENFIVGKKPSCQPQPVEVWKRPRISCLSQAQQHVKKQ